MSVSVTINGTSYTIPTTGETGWGNNVTTWIQAASQHLLQKTGGAFTLTAEVNFGATYGLKSVYYKSSAGTVSTTGAIRLGASDLISWRNNANTQDLELSVDSSDRLNYNGNPVFGPNALSASKALESDSNGVIQSSSVTSTELGRLSGIGSSAVGVSDSQTLTNKTIDGDDNTVQDLALSSLKTQLADASKFLVRDASGVVISNTKGVPTGDVVGISDSQILTNKTIDADSNTITNIENADIKSGAAIARNKLASGTNSHVLINDGSGVMSSEAQLATSRGGTGVNSTATFPSSGTVAVVPSSGVVKSNGTALSSSNVNLASEVTGTLPIANGGTGATTKTDAFDALAPTTTAGDFIVYNGTDNVRQGIGSDGQVLVVDSTLGNKLKWTTLQQGAKNYITYNNFENNALTGWNEASVTWTSGAPSGAPTVSASAAASIALSVTSTTPLAGTYSLQMLGTIAQGQGFCTDVLTIDREDQAKVLQGSFYYEVTAGATNANFSGTSSNTLSVYIYDVTNSAWIQPAGVYNLVQSSGQGLCTFTFQTPASISQLRLFVFAANTASGSITVEFDDFALGPQKILSGAAISDWQSYTPTGSWTTNATYSGQWRRVGDSAEVAVSIALSGAPTGTLNNITLPSGITIDTAKIAGYASNANMVGTGSVKAAGAAYYPIEVMVTSATTLLPAVWSAAGTYVGVDANITATVPGTFANGDFVRFIARFPVSGFSSNTVMSSDTDTRVIACRYTKVSQAVTTGSTDVISSVTSVSDTSGSLNTTSGVYTVPVSGFYKISAAVASVSTAWTAGSNRYASLRVSGTNSIILGTQAIWASVTNYLQLEGSTTRYYDAGQTISVSIENQTGSTFTQSATATENWVSIERVSGPATIAASEAVYFSANTNALSAIGTSFADLVYEDVITNSHGAYSGSTGIFTAPVSGVYQFNYCFGTASVTLTTAQRVIATLNVDGTVVSQSRTNGTGAANNYIVGNSFIVKLNAGQQVKVQAISSVATTTESTATATQFSGVRIGY